MDKRAAFLMLVPAGVFFLLSFAVPMVLVGRLSLYRANYVAQTFILFDNYINAFQDPYFIKSFVNTIWFLLMIGPPIVGGGYLIASFLTDFPERIQSIGRFIVYIPGLASGLIMALLWDWILLRNGLLNQFLSLVGIKAIPWLTQPWTTRIALSVITVFGGLGSMVILFAASMKSISKELKDAAMIDGATNTQYKHHIVLPLMMPTIMLCVLLEVITIMQMFETMYVLAGNGGPQGSASSPVYEIFLTAFRFGKAGFAAAKGIILMAIIALIILMQKRIEKWRSR